MPTAGDLITETIGTLNGWSLDEEQSTTLAADMGPGDLSFTVTATRGVATGASPGIIEIGSELLYVDSVQPDGTVTVVPWGRGYLNTTAVMHSAGARVISQPSFPRSKVLDKLNETINRVYPEVFGVASHEATTTFPVFTYQLPSNAERCLQVKWQPPSGTQYWVGCSRWRMSAGGGSMFGDQGVSVDVKDPVIPGRPIQFLYQFQPATFASEADDFATVTGLQAGLRDVLVLGAAAKLAASLELSRLQTASVEQQDRSRLVSPSAGLTSSRYLEQEFTQRLAEERVTLRQLYRPRIVRDWI